MKISSESIDEKMAIKMGHMPYFLSLFLRITRYIISGSYNMEIPALKLLDEWENNMYYMLC